MTNKDIWIDLIMLSKFGKNDGGRETWAYNFLPALIQDKKIKLNIFGYRLEEEEDNTQLLVKLDRSNNKKVNPIILSGEKNKFPKFISMLLKLKSFLKNFDKPKPNYTIAMGIFELIIMLLNKRFSSGIRVVWLRSIFLNEKSYKIPNYLIKLAEKLEYILLKKVDIILANGDDIKAHYEQFDLEVIVIKNGIDAKKWYMKPPILSKTIKIAYIGRLSQVKGIDSYIELIEKVKKSIYANNFEFHIVGDANNYLEDIKKIEAKNHVIYHGSINNTDLVVFLEIIDVCVALTYVSSSGGGGGTSNALLEQMAASKVIIAWDNAIFQQLLNNTNAYMVEQYSIDLLESSLLDILNNPNNAIKRAIKANETIVPYSIGSQVNKFEKTINEFKK
jgi:glycosyltransferase involved in cell wall biosynthesis